MKRIEIRIDISAYMILSDKKMITKFNGIRKMANK
jgi:hypothetical protein